MRRLAMVVAVALLVAGCGSGAAKSKLAATAGAAADEETTTTGVPADETTTTAVAPDSTTSIPAPEASTTTVQPNTTTTARQVTTTVAPTTTTFTTSTSSTTVPQVTTTTGPAPTTTTTKPPLKQLTALTVGGNCSPASIPEAIDMGAIKTQLEAEGYATPTPVQFRDSNGKAIPVPVEQNRNDAMSQWHGCFDASGGRKFTITLKAVAGEDGSPRFAGLVSDQAAIPPAWGSLVVS